MKKVRQIALTCLLLLALCFCATTTTAFKSGDTVIIGGIKPVLQDEMGCMPAILEMIFRYNGVDMDKRKIADELGQGYGGTKLNTIDPFLNKHGFVAGRVDFSTIKQHINGQAPVIVAGK